MRLVFNLNESFKPTKVTFQKTKFETLPVWGSDSSNDNDECKLPLTITDYSSIKDSRKHRTSPFHLSKEINNRLIIWKGDITTLEVDAITNLIDETLIEKNFISQKILERAGPQLKLDLVNEIIECKTGGVYVTNGYNLPAKYIIHTVGPIYTERYKTDAENTLYSCYRNVLCKVKELKLKTIALCIISSTQRNFPPDLGAHIALRIIRRFLEKSKTETVILYIEPHEKKFYEILTPLYFPKDKSKENIAFWYLPKDIIGGKIGEPQYPDRQIRIIHNPQHSVMIGADDESDTNPHDLDDCNSDTEYDPSDINSGLGLGSHLNIGQHSFSQMQGDLDKQRLLGERPRAGVYENVIENGLEGLEQQERYERLLRRARTEDLSEISGIGCLYQSGVDRLGRPVIVFCGKWFPAQDVDLDKAMLYLIYLLDPIVKGDYVIAYFHTLTSTNNYPSLHWLREVYSVLPYKYKKNLKAFYIVHPTFWTKMMTWWFTTFMAPAIKAKVHSLPGVEHLYSAISKDQLEIPAYITEYDMATNGLHYFQPLAQTPS